MDHGGRVLLSIIAITGFLNNRFVFITVYLFGIMKGAGTSVVYINDIQHVSV